MSDDKRPWIDQGGFGYAISKEPHFSLWWSESTYKISPHTPVPSEQRPSVELEAGRNEWESFQLVFRPHQSLRTVKITFTPFQADSSEISRCPLWAEVFQVQFVPVTIPTGNQGDPGLYPDPLIPLHLIELDKDYDRNAVKPISVSFYYPDTDTNLILYLSVFVPKSVPPGLYQSSIRITIGQATAVSLPVRLRVYDVTYPDEPPLRTAYGVNIDNDFHRLQTPDQFRRVWDLYMQTCRRFRVSPYTPYEYSHIKWTMKGPTTVLSNWVLRLAVDRFSPGSVDISMRWPQKPGTHITPYYGLSLKSLWKFVLHGGLLIGPVRSSWIPIGSYTFLLETFEKEGIGYQGTGIGWVGPEKIKSINIVHRSRRELVADLTVAKVTSQAAARSFEATIRLSLTAGLPYFQSRLLRLANTDSTPWTLNGYFHLVRAESERPEAVNTPNYGLWLWKRKEHPLAFGGAGSAFTYSLRVNPETGGQHGDIYRKVGITLQPGQVWEPENEPTVAIFALRAKKEKIDSLASKIVDGTVKPLRRVKTSVGEERKTTFRYDFSDFDKAMSRYLDQFHFTSFNLVILPPTLAGHPQFSPEYNEILQQLMKPILDHLKKKGWLKKAYCYWVDEPLPEQYEFVRRGMATLKQTYPGVRRLLTNYVEKFPSPNFYGLVDLWVPILSQFDPERSKERQMLGEEIWWYVCTGPGAPYPNNFIDHPAITHRIRYWMAAKWNLDGDLYWSMTYYRGAHWKPRNPWQDGQSERPDGGGYWGNGDGRLLYPPSKEILPPDAPPVLKGPYPSLRLAQIREGIEDYTTIWLLRKKVAELQKHPTAAPLLTQSQNALAALDRLIRSMTDYERDPRKLYQERSLILKTLEALNQFSPRQARK
ncbi:MAG: DUF4091 domain-containing protein [Armatimonadetes bacterium]|nr:DUF4091 domain-containing protein [Armatimonadota bacterium]MDW8122498.1 DUF4091 domain-containing protein [Armatimonadota bacterium]